MSSRNQQTYIPRRAVPAGIGPPPRPCSCVRMFASAADAAPVRLLIVHCPCGANHDSFFSQGGLTDFVLPPMIQSLEPFRSDMVILEGISCPRSNDWIGDKHSGGMITMSGKRFIGIPGTDSIVGAGADGNAKNIVAQDKTFDQLLLDLAPKVWKDQGRIAASHEMRPSSVGLPSFLRDVAYQVERAAVSRKPPERAVRLALSAPE